MTPELIISPADRDTAARTIEGEAGSEPRAGRLAVAWVIRNRAQWDEMLDPSHPEHEWWGVDVAKVCLHPFQFSCWNPGRNAERIKAMPVASMAYREAMNCIDLVMSGQIHDPTGGASHYKVRGTTASWDKAIASIKPRSIGRHDFWRLSPSGEALAFLDEPMAA